ncbi:MAG: TspO/MBR family protein [bacterium]
MKGNIVKFVISLLLCQFTGFLGSLFTKTSVQSWYRTIEKPTFNPPDYLFAPVWTILFILMGISFFLVWKNNDKPEEKTFAVMLFLFHLVVNISWSAVFFWMQSITGGFFVILFLLAMILLLIMYFRDFSAMASILLVPYFLWVSFAAILNYSIMVLN